MDTLVKLKVVWEVSRNGSHSFFSANSNVQLKLPRERRQYGLHGYSEDGLSAAILGSVMDTLALL